MHPSASFEEHEVPYGPFSVSPIQPTPGPRHLRQPFCFNGRQTRKWMVDSNAQLSVAKLSLEDSGYWIFPFEAGPPNNSFTSSLMR